MDVAEAIRLAAENGCDMEWDEDARRWVVGAVSYDADACSLDSVTLSAIDADTFLRDFLPDRDL
ncbi:hypothetical protein [Algiphilus sp.]|uniref:hypothetical protein n=1 Tax=Algiphilus sp. TaxID=1872431 RepID=UPI0025BB5A84|nr:hypothetical protein [Algiphilus sp.]MCK5770442.1 hypothetical protein [Algiphilus sp.]